MAAPLIVREQSAISNAGAISDGELAAWTVEIRSLLDAGKLFASEGYFLFINRHAQK